MNQIVSPRWENDDEGLEPSSYVYFVLAPAVGLVKIGTANSVMKRFWDLQTGSPVELKLLGSMRVRAADARVTERGLHAQFDTLRVRGEWFSYNDALASFIDKRKDKTLVDIDTWLAAYDRLPPDKRLEIMEAVAAARKAPSPLIDGNDR